MALILTPADGTLFTANSGVPFTQTIFTTDGTGPYVYSFQGDLPDGITFSSDGVSATVAGNASITENVNPFGFAILVTDELSDTGYASYSLELIPVIDVNPPYVNIAANGVAYSETFVVSGGTPPYGFVILPDSNALPSGIIFNANVTSNTATLTGAANYVSSNVANNVYSFSIQATDSANLSGSTDYELVVVESGVTFDPPAGNLVDTNPGDNYYVTIQAYYNGNSSIPFTYALSPSNTLPNGVSFTTNAFNQAVLSGLVTNAGVFPITITADDGAGNVGNVDYTITSNAPSISVYPTPPSLDDAFPGIPYTQLFTVTGGTEPYTFDNTGSNLPPGISFSSTTSNAIISGSPTQSGTFSANLTVTDSYGFTTTPSPLEYSLTVLTPTITLSPTVSSFNSNISRANIVDGNTYPNVAFSTAYNLGNLGTFNYSISNGSLPTGLSLVGNTISGTVQVGGITTPQTYTFDITTTSNSLSNYSNTNTGYSITVSAPTVVLTPASGPLSNVVQNTSTSYSFVASGGKSPYTFVKTGTIPTGMSWSNVGNNTVTLSGAPTNYGNFAFNVTATDLNGYQATGNYSFSVTPLPIIKVLPTGLDPGYVNVGYSRNISAVGSPNLPFTFTVSSGSLPPGLSLGNATSSTITLSGIPTADGDYEFVITATDSLGYTGQRPYVMTVFGAPTIQIFPSYFEPQQVDVPFKQEVQPTNGTNPYEVFVSFGELPPGLELEPLTPAKVTWQLVGTPTDVGLYRFTLTATDIYDNTGFRRYEFLITPPPPPPITDRVVRVIVGGKQLLPSEFTVIERDPVTVRLNVAPLLHEEVIVYVLRGHVWYQEDGTII